MISVKKKVLIICRNDLKRAPRFIMEVNALKDKYEILAYGESGTIDGGYNFIPVKPLPAIDFHLNYPTILRKALSFFISRIFSNQNAIKRRALNFELNQLVNKDFDLVIVHHLKDLPLGVKLAESKKVKVIFNAHEYYPLEYEDIQEWMKTTHFEYMDIARKYLPKVDICFCVGEIIAKKYFDEFALNSIVITNSKKYYNLEPKMPGDKIRLIYHGGAVVSRRIDLMIEMMNHLDDSYTLDLILVGSPVEYENELKKMAQSNKNITFLSPVDIEQIPVFTNSYDIGVFLLPPTNFNYANALPNKFFEFLQARLAIAIGPSPEMELLVKRYDLGIVANDFTAASMANAIKSVGREKLYYYKTQCNKYAKELSIESNMEKIREEVDKLVA